MKCHANVAHEHEERPGPALLTRTELLREAIHRNVSRLAWGTATETICPGDGRPAHCPYYSTHSLSRRASRKLPAACRSYHNSENLRATAVVASDGQATAHQLFVQLRRRYSAPLEAWIGYLIPGSSVACRRVQPLRKPPVGPGQVLVGSSSLGLSSLKFGLSWPVLSNDRDTRSDRQLPWRIGLADDASGLHGYGSANH